MKISRSANVLGRLAKLNSYQIAIIFTVILTSVLIAVLAIFNPAKAQTIPTNLTVVRPADVRPFSEVATGPAGWYEEAVGTGNVELTTTKPMNTAGSAEFTIGDSSSYVELGLYKELGGRALSTVDNINYATYQENQNAKAVSLQIGLDTDVTDSDVSWQGRLVYEPYLNTAYYPAGPLASGVYQTWITTQPDDQWWMTWSSSLTTKYGANPCPQGDPCSYADILADFPNAGFNAGFGSPLILKAGSGWSSFTGFADLPSIGHVSTGYEIWDFEPGLAAPTSKEDCFNEGWASYGALFKNQGACVAYVVKNQ